MNYSQKENLARMSVIAGMFAVLNAIAIGTGGTFFDIILANFGLLGVVMVLLGIERADHYHQQAKHEQENRK